jgi:hypothetical protein
METRTQDAAGYYVWEVPGQAAVVRLRLDVVDRLAAEVMRGFGSVPKRGAEVGGVLIGTIRPGIPGMVRIDDFEPVACEYRRGPSYQFTEEDGAALEDCWRRLQPSVSPAAYAVGYFRSHTRDGFSLEPEDLEMLDRLFPGPAHVALLIKPYGTKVSVGGFFIREHGEFPETTRLEFPLQSRELQGKHPAPHSSLAERRVEAQGDRNANVTAPPDAPPQAASGYTGSEPPLPQYSVPASPRSGPRSGWVWLPLVFLFLLLGIGLGYELALSLGSRAAAAAVPDFSLSLSVSKSGDNLRLNWNRLSPAVRYARRGLLEIDDGGYTRPVTLDAAQLQNGSLIYRNASNSVRFRMTVFPQARVSIVETLEWKQ